MAVENLNRITEKTLLGIYNDFFKRSIENCLDIFLCGRGNVKGEATLRNALREKFETEKNISIMYPEDLFIDIFNRTKHYDMLYLEKFLAHNCDIICIICEDNSPGAFVELGAFTNNSDTFEKVFAMVQAKYKTHKSFIMLGPIKYIQQKNKDNVLYYSSDVEETYKELLKRFKNKLRQKDKPRDKDIDSIIGQYYFILMVVYFYKTIPVKDLIKYIKYIIDVYEFKIEDFDLLYSASLKQLYKDKMIVKNLYSSADFYSLTDKGKSKFYNTFESLDLIKKTKKGDAIRLSILSQQSYKHHPS